VTKTRAPIRRTRSFSAAVPGGRIVGWNAGEGPPALVLHGGPMSDYTEPLARMLADSFWTVRYQQRGLPPSTTAGPFFVEAHVEDAVRVLDVLGIDRAWAVGHSWGAHLAFHLAVQRPDRLLGVIAVSPLGAVSDGGWAELDRNLFARLRSHSPSDAARAQEIDERATAGEATSEEVREALELLWPCYFGDPRSAPPIPEIAINVDLSSGVVTSVYEHFERGTLAASLPAYEGPFLLIHGESDPLPVAASRATAALVPHAVVETIEDCGHFPWLERPERFAAVVRAFVGTSLPAVC
jgi:pimeloyl-ACP methyl ester carboxylesterase